MIETTISATGAPAVIIEPKDLRIGNILTYKGEYVHMTTLSMDIDDEYEETIGFCKLGKDNNEIADWNRALCADLNPVPLSPEILRNADLISTFPEDGIWQLRSFEFRLTDVGLILLDENREPFFGSKPLKYLHELQNLYFALMQDEAIVHF
jgi:hypothetical protein